MVSSEASKLQSSQMAKFSLRNRASSFLTDSFLFAGGAMVALLLVWSICSFVSPDPNPTPAFSKLTSQKSSLDASRACVDGARCPNLGHDPPETNFYDDPAFGYTVDSPVKDWDGQRREWLKLHPSFAAGDQNRVLLVTGSQPKPCKNPIGDHILLRFFKNKVDYCRIHGYDIFYNNVLLQPKMFSFWAKIPVIRASMLAHPESEWIWWVDSDALFTDMDFRLPLERYRNHNFVVHGWPHLVHEKKSWTAINAGVFLIRNCQWAMNFMDTWAQMGPQSPEYEKWGEIQRSTFRDKLFPESDDQTGLAYLILTEKKWADRIYLENSYYFQGYWLDIVGTLDNIIRKYEEMERETRTLRRRHAEKVSERYGALWEQCLEKAGIGYGRDTLSRPFITHFTGCQPCSGARNQEYSGQSCWTGMQRALTFADNQVLRKYGYVHPSLVDSASVRSVPFDYPA